ncbi:MAG: Na/Pi symporter [Candidatus ainarchaeum sp.]|nr:Na/Pi symporter [Candidatus ainarchaeum sp.]
MFSNPELWFAIIPAIIIFLYGIDNFSREMQKAIGSQFNYLLKWLTKGKIRATIFGALITAIIQASAATTLIAIGLVNTGAITFSQSLGIIFGANIGTTVTSQLVAFNLMQFAPILIIIGFVLSLLKTKYKVFGKPIFYFGLVMFALNIISISVIPFKSDPELMALLAQTSIIPIGILIGFLITNIFQSSSVTTGLVVILAQNGMLGLPEALPILFGANIGTTVLSIIVSIRMDAFAKRAALAHFLFNFIGVLICLPLIGLIINAVEFIGGSTAQQVANSHLIFNLFTTIILLLFINYFQKIVERLIPTEEEEIVLRTKNLENLKNEKTPKIFSLIELELKNNFDSIIKLFNENNVLLLSNKISNSKISKLSALVEYTHNEIKKILTMLFKNPDKKESEKILLFARISTLCNQISDSGKKLGETIIFAKENKIDFSEEGKRDIDECLAKLTENMIIIKEKFPNFDKKSSIEMTKNSNYLRKTITKSYEEYLKRISKGQSTSGSIFAESLSIIQDLESKIREIRKIFEK